MGVSPTRDSTEATSPLRPPIGVWCEHQHLLCIFLQLFLPLCARCPSRQPCSLALTGRSAGLEHLRDI